MKCKCGQNKSKHAESCNDCRIENIMYNPKKGTFTEQVIRAVNKHCPIILTKI